MKRLILLAVCVLALAACPTKDKEIRTEWETLLPGSLTDSGLYRYVDKEYGIIVYCGDNSRMTSQPIQRTK